MRAVNIVACGIVNSDGTIKHAGSGNWMSYKTTTGRYLIRFTPALDRAPIVVVTPHHSNGLAVMAHNSFPTREQADLYSVNLSTATAADEAFEFFAILSDKSR